MAESDNVEVLLLDLLEWLNSSPRPYSEVLESWLTSCPRLPIWETAVERGFVVRHQVSGQGQVISISARGSEYLHLERKQSNVT